MAVLDIIYSILLNLFPLILFALPIPFIRKKKFGLFYSRLYLGLCVFFLVYWVLPVLFQFEFAKPPISSNDSPEGLGVGYLFARSFSMFSLYLQYPFRILPF